MGWDARGQRPLSVEEAYAKALDRDRSVGPQKELGYRLYWLREDVVGCAHVRPDDGHLILGRHSRCDVVLAEQDEISLRHVLARTVVTDDGSPMLSLLDLDTKVGFELSDETRQHAIMASGPVAFRIGAYSLVALPSSGDLAPTLPRVLVSQSDSGDHRVIAKRVEHDPFTSRVSRVTVVPRSRSIADIPARGAVGAPMDVAAYRLALQVRGRRAIVELSIRDVEHGVLIGRANKCLDAGLSATLDLWISRVHALVIREADHVFLYDTASTSGTYAGGERARRVELTDGGGCAQLTRQAPVLVSWRRTER